MCVCVLCLAVDDQLDEDDLELIKENIGFDIQAVSLCLFSSGVTGRYYIIHIHYTAEEAAEGSL